MFAVPVRARAPPAAVAPRLPRALGEQLALAGAVVERNLFVRRQIALTEQDPPSKGSELPCSIRQTED